MEKKVEISIGRKIELARREKGWNQEELAKRTKINRTTISLYESDKGTENMSIDSLKRIAKATEKPICYFFSEEYTTENLPSNILGILKDPVVVRIAMFIHKHSEEIKEISKAIVKKTLL